MFCGPRRGGIVMSCLPNTVGDAGAWVMFDGTPYAYLHICGTPWIGNEVRTRSGPDLDHAIRKAIRALTLNSGREGSDGAAGADLAQ